MSDLDIPCTEFMAMPMLTWCTWLADLNPGSAWNLAQFPQSKHLAGHKGPDPAMTSKHNKKPRKQSELLSRGIKNLAAGVAQLKSMIQQLRQYMSKAFQQSPPENAVTLLPTYQRRMLCLQRHLEDSFTLEKTGIIKPIISTLCLYYFSIARQMFAVVRHEKCWQSNWK